jgi:hypothetical protein
VSRDREVQKIAAEVEALLDGLRANVATLNGILVRPAGRDDGGEAGERLVTQ